MAHGAMPYGGQMPGHGPNPGQAMGHMQMHPGASGPGAPHVSQAGPMMGMQPGMQGGGPQAQALQHLTPQPQMFHQQIPQSLANNPQAMAAWQHQARQHHLLQQQRAQQQHMMPGAPQQGNMGMAFGGGGNPPFNAAQFAQMQAQNPQMGVQLPGHLSHQQQLLQQQHNMMRQQQAQQAQQAQQQAQQQALANSQHLAMQHATSQSSNQGQGTPHAQQAQHPQQPQMRPQPQTSAAPEAHSSPAQPPNPQQNTSQPQQTPQQAPQQPVGQPQAAQQGQQPQQNQQGVPKAVMQRMQQGFNQQQHQMMQRQMQQAVQQQQQQANRMSGASTLRLYQFADHISRYKASEQTSRDEQPWREFVERFFATDSSLRHVVKDLKSSHSKQFEVLYPSLPRYFHIHYEGVDQIQILIEQPSERMTQSPQGIMFHIVEAARAKFIYWFKNGTQLVCSGKIWAIFSEDKITTLHYETQEYEQYVSRSEIELVFSRSTVNATKSPRMTKKAAANQRNQPRQGEAVTTLAEIPEAPVGALGVIAPVQTFFEINETITMMTEIMRHVQENPGVAPKDALSALVDQYSAQMQQNPQQTPQQPHINLPPNGMQQMMQQGAGMPPGARTPGQMGMQQNANMNMPQGFMASPAMQHQFLPGGMPGVNGGGSPHINLNAANLNPGVSSNVHTPSPAQAHMQAPSMVQQMSQQGSTGSGASVNTSPNVAGNKRRRPSAVKTEDEGGGEVNGVQGKVKQSPRVGQNKRVKGS
ncbi:hypothetical protein NA57DRAFT_58707 [Rhizodiscina lignyota]|uniref:LIM-domain binding protein-domain-containing protein n=1 Tax=Rhizodiscina lignyota TaxID=1504668 RepID=A0A9P4M4H7_9PEZI|nr:hypothetical protein NA57DRAFT_58707 [Rhizodiscina lignyota]